MPVLPRPSELALQRSAAGRRREHREHVLREATLAAVRRHAAAAQVDPGLHFVRFRCGQMRAEQEEDVVENTRVHGLHLLGHPVPSAKQGKATCTLRSAIASKHFW
eukprot:2730354-Pyramimonas_sp.AAC.2